MPQRSKKLLLQRTGMIKAVERGRRRFQGDQIYTRYHSIAADWQPVWEIVLCLFRETEEMILNFSSSMTGCTTQGLSLGK